MNHPTTLAFSPAAERNRGPIIEALRPILNSHKSSLLLEVASGTGQHAAALAEAFPHLHIQPSDLTLERSHDVSGWASQHGAGARVAALRQLDAQSLASSWSGPSPDIIYCANMIHISPWEATVGLFEGAASLLPEGGHLILYGPYQFETSPLAPSNIAFDASLRERNPLWGIRSIVDLDALASKRRMIRILTEACPANNHVLVYQAS